VSYRYSFEDLLALLHGHAPAKVDAVALHRRRVEHGHLSVGLKIHCLGDGSQFSTLVEGLGGGPVAELVGIEGGVVSGVFNLESSGVEAPDRRPRHEEHYHEA